MEGDALHELESEGRAPWKLERAVEGVTEQDVIGGARRQEPACRRTTNG